MTAGTPDLGPDDEADVLEPPAVDAEAVPEQTRDDTDAGWGEQRRGERDPHEEWLLDQRPPHWD